MFKANPDLPLSRFMVDAEKCTACGKCVKDCTAEIIAVNNGIAGIKPANDAECLLCQHCLAVCPTAAASVDGCYPEASLPLEKIDPAPLDLLMRGRRSVRRFAPGVVDRSLVDRLLATASHAPTGVNIRHRHFTLVHNPEVMADLRNRVARELTANRSTYPEEISWLVESSQRWLDEGVDEIFRKAPHMLIVTAGAEGVCKVADCLIALSYFELYAQANGVGTVWCGFVEKLLRYVPKLWDWLAIPRDDTLGYAMLFGPPGVEYARTTQHHPDHLTVVEKLAEI